MRYEKGAGSPRSVLTSFDDLAVFRRAYDISLAIHGLSQSFPKNEQYGGLADQMRRASKSICANIAEGFAKRHVSGSEFKRFLMMAFGSCEEMQVWLRYCKDLQFLPLEETAKLTQEYTEISKMIFSLHRSWKK